MGGSYYSRDDAAARFSLRSDTAKAKGIDYTSAAFAHDHDIKTGKTAARVHDTLKPFKVRRESRDSDAHPVSVPICIFMDTTGSMASVPAMLQERLTHLMGAFLDDKASGKKYLGDGYPAILIGGLDDYEAMRGPEGTLQVGQFESGIEIDDNLTNLWITHHGGGTYEESYELALYFAARCTAHDHHDKRGRKGYLFLIGDEHAYAQVSSKQVKELLGETLQSDVLTKDIVRECQKLYHIFMVIPNMTNHYHDENLAKDWMALLGQQNVIRLEDPTKICETIVGAVAISESHIGVDDLKADGIDIAALVPLSKSGVAVHSTDGLVPAAGHAGGVERL